jgi:hypothetical protein
MKNKTWERERERGRGGEFKKIVWERERESEREGEYKNIKNGGGRGRGRGRGSERENKKFPCRFGIHQSLCHMGWGREKEEKKNVPRIPL